MLDYEDVKPKVNVDEKRDCLISHRREKRKQRAFTHLRLASCRFQEFNANFFISRGSRMPRDFRDARALVERRESLRSASLLRKDSY